MVLKAYLIITGAAIHFPGTKNTGGDRQSLKLHSTVQMAVTKLSDVEARGRRNPRRSKNVTRTTTKTTTPVKSHSHGPLALCKRVKRRNPGALAVSPPGIVRLNGTSTCMKSGWVSVPGWTYTANRRVLVRPSRNEHGAERRTVQRWEILEMARHQCSGHPPECSGQLPHLINTDTT